MVAAVRSGQAQAGAGIALRWLSQPSVWLGAACLLTHLLVNGRYGVFRDELYFIVCGQHPDFGYVDQPPLAPIIAGASYALFGTALLPLRIIPALAMTATVMLTAEFARALGGGRFAQTLSGLAVLAAPVFLVDGLVLTTDFLQPLTWLGCSWCLLRLGQTGDQRWWIAFGAIVGVSMESKYLIAAYVGALSVGAALTPLRASLRRPQIYFGAALALALAAPSLCWQAANGWPFFALVNAETSGKNLALSPVEFFGQQVLFVGPLAAPLWLAGLWRFGFRPNRPEHRAYAIAYAVMFLVFDVIHGKPYFLTPIYPTLLACGGIEIERWLVGRAPRALAIGALGGAGALAAPFALPLLPAGDVAPYAHALGIKSYAAATEREAQGALPQELADMFGWPEMAAKVSAIYQALPPAERAKAVFFGRNYGEAAAVEVYGPALGGPPSISGHNNYFLWGPKGYDGSVVITLGGDRAQLSGMFRRVEIAGEVDCPYAMPYETHLPIYVLREPRQSLATMWPSLRDTE